jgi:hypothetical protein
MSGVTLRGKGGGRRNSKGNLRRRLGEFRVFNTGGLWPIVVLIGRFGSPGRPGTVLEASGIGLSSGTDLSCQ